jgi:hypothetical protein
LKNFILTNSNDSQRTGALSDGLHWTIWHNYDGWYLANFNTQSIEDAFTLLRLTKLQAARDLYYAHVDLEIEASLKWG